MIFVIKTLLLKNIYTAVQKFGISKFFVFFLNKSFMLT